MFLALLLFLASGMATNIKRIIRHPQLTGVATGATPGTLLRAGRDTETVTVPGGA